MLLIRPWQQGNSSFIPLPDEAVGHHSGTYPGVSHLSAQVHPHNRLREWALNDNGSTPHGIQLYFWEDLQRPRYCREKKSMPKKFYIQMDLSFSHTLNLRHLSKPSADPRAP